MLSCLISCSACADAARDTPAPAFALSGQEGHQWPTWEPGLISAEGLYYGAARPGCGKDGERPMLLVGRGGQQVLRGPLIGRGTFTKVYLGMDRDERLLAVRVQRLPERTALKGRRRGRKRPVLERSRMATDREEALARRGGPAFAALDSGVGMGRAFAFVHLRVGDAFDASTALRRRGRASDLPDLVFRVLADGSAGLAVLHAAGVLHNDVKPENLLVDRAGHLHLSDFGMAAVLPAGSRSLTSGGGTRVYAAAEVFAGAKEQSPASDVWSLAATAAALAVSDLDALRRQPRNVHMKLKKFLGGPLATFVVDEMGAARPENRPSAARCREVIAAAPRPPAGASKTFFLSGAETGMTNEVDRLRAAWRAVRPPAPAAP